MLVTKGVFKRETQLLWSYQWVQFLFPTCCVEKKREEKTAHDILFRNFNLL